MLSMDDPANTQASLKITGRTMEEAPPSKRQRVADYIDEESEDMVECSDADSTEDETDEDSEIEEKTMQLEAMVKDLSDQNDELEARIQQLEDRRTELKTSARHASNADQRIKTSRKRKSCFNSVKKCDSNLQGFFLANFIQLLFLLVAAGRLSGKCLSEFLSASCTKDIRCPSTIRSVPVCSLQQSNLSLNATRRKNARLLLVHIAAASAQMSMGIVRKFGNRKRPP